MSFPGFGLHKKIIEPVLSALSDIRSEYFNRLVDEIGRDPRTESMPNLVYLVLKETIPYLPMYLEENELREMLLEFVSQEQARLNRIIHDREFLDNPGKLGEVTKEFVLQVLSLTLEEHQLGKISDLRQKEENTYRFSYPDGLESDFPYRDDDE